ncbi:MAG: FHA domain-containing protein [Myxococcaceae bacterium]
MATLVVRHPDGTQTEHELAGQLTIGRQEGNDLVLSEGGVSRKHATISAEGADVAVEDHGSANGTFVDGEKISGKVKVGPRAAIVIGDYELTLKSGAVKKPGSGSKPKVGGAAANPPPKDAPAGGPRATQARPAVAPPRATKMVPAQKPGGAMLAKKAGAAPAAPAKPAGGAPQGAHLRGITGPWANKIYPVRGKILVGRVPGVNVLVEDDSVSRRHAELEKTAEGVIVRDLGSANGTLLNGTTLAPEEAVVLQQGDILQFGVIEMSFEPGEAEVLNVPTRRGAGGAPPSRSGRGGAPAAGGGGGGGGGLAALLADPQKKKLVMIAGGALVLLIAGGGIVKAMSHPTEEQVVDNGGGPGGGVMDVDPQAELNQLVSECRTYSSTELGTDPDWVRAEKACNKALKLEPIHPEATALKRKIAVEKDAWEFYKAAEKLSRVQRDEEALDQYAKIPEESAYYRKARPRVRETVVAVKKRVGEDCDKNVRDRYYSTALPRCEKYMQIACCDMTPEQLTPPPGMKIVTDRPRKNEWKPDDKTPEGKMYVRYLMAKQKSPDFQGALEPFVCPNTRVFCSIEVSGPDPRKEVAEAFKSRYPDPKLQTAMMAYYEGRELETQTNLAQLRENRDKAQLHAVVDQLKNDTASVAQFYKLGESLIQADKALDADEPFHEALTTDERLMKELTEKRPSFYRKSINADMARACYTEGKKWADRKDFKKACSAWKIGYRYSRADADLLRALGNACSNQAAEMIKAADSCEALTAAADLAVPGDGNDKKIEAARAELKCPAPTVQDTP